MFIIIGKFEEEAKNNSLLTGCSHNNYLISQKVKVTVNWHNIEVINTALSLQWNFN